MFYLDASVVVPMFLPEPASEAILSWIASCEVPVSRSAYAAAAKLAGNAASGLRAGDSLHLAMAIEVGAIALATSDSSLARNAEANGMAVRRF